MDVKRLAAGGRNRLLVAALLCPFQFPVTSGTVDRPQGEGCHEPQENAELGKQFDHFRLLSNSMPPKSNAIPTAFAIQNASQLLLGVCCSTSA